MIDDNQAKMFFRDGVGERYSLVADPTLEDADRLWNEWLDAHDRRVERALADRRLPDTPGLWADRHDRWWLVWHRECDGMFARPLADRDAETVKVRGWKPDGLTPFKPLTILSSDIWTDDMYRPGLFRDRDGSIWWQIQRDDGVYEARMIAFKYGWQWGDLDDPSGCGPFTLMTAMDMDWTRPNQ
ncbi:hypothetical protein [Bifidobacterium sp. SO1]|uniref:hypothetical protein n=1 Tax=Bifidobacterium sp. SO1 TaxID=2809029 RepID=UPI001BDC9023|nr:hypothetical protein [Bifidobacterium sp. SO1]MBT1162825.1 hypothetical protein [Bifidobacterium sp. SO1]